MEDVEKWKLKRTLDNLEAARGSGTSVITLLIPSKGQLGRAQRLLADELATAACIRSKANRKAVVAAITSAQERIKKYSKLPPNGLAVFCGLCVAGDGNVRKLTVELTPSAPLAHSTYLCDDRFHTEALRRMLDDEQRFGFVVVDGSGALFAAVSGAGRTLLERIRVSLPKKHGRGGFSANRFERLRLEARANYVRKVAEGATKHFLSDDVPTVAGLVLAGVASLKAELAQSNVLDPRLARLLIASLDVAYGGTNGLHQAIEMAAPLLGQQKLLVEKKIIARFFEELMADSGKCCFGASETVAALQSGSVLQLIASEKLQLTRMKVVNKTDDTTDVLYLDLDRQKLHDQKLQTDQAAAAARVEREVVESEPLLEWLADNYGQFGCEFHIVGDSLPEGAQFLHGFGGLGGVLRYRQQSCPQEELLEEGEVAYD